MLSLLHVPFIFFQIVSVCQGGTVIIWMIDTGQKVKNFKTHNGSEVTALAQDITETRIYTGSTDGTVKVNLSVVLKIG